MSALFADAVGRVWDNLYRSDQHVVYASNTATKLTSAQIRALQYFSAVKDGVGQARRRELRLTYPTKKVQDSLLAKGFLQVIKEVRYDYSLKYEVPYSIIVISPTGEAALGKDEAF